MDKLLVEYLVMMEHKGSFCSNIESFNKLLETNSLVTIKKNKIIFESTEFVYEIFSEDVKDKNQRFFRIKLTGTDESIIPIFLELLKTIREQIKRAEGNLNVLWDDISNYYSAKAYPEINRIENLMRKLLTSFMLTNIGLNWTDETLPSEMRSSLKKKGKSENPNINVLHETDFIQLADFLFRPYQTNDINNLFKTLKSTKKSEELDLKELKEYIPRSNWERYFKSFVNFEDGYLNKKWTRLYELRCIVAHNNLLNKFEFEETIELIKELEPKIKEALNSIDKIVIPKEEKEQVIVNAVTAIDERSKVFFEKYRDVEEEIKRLYKREYKDEEEGKLALKKRVKILVEKNILSQEFLNELNPIGAFRDKLATLSDKISQEEIETMTNQVSEFYSKRVFLEPPFITL